MVSVMGIGHSDVRSNPGQDGICLTSHRVRVWHKAVLLWGLHMTRDSWMAGEKIIDPVGISPMLSLRYQAINLVPPK